MVFGGWCGHLLCAVGDLLRGLEREVLIARVLLPVFADGKRAGCFLAEDLGREISIWLKKRDENF